MSSIDEQAVLAANEAFYRAFADGDVVAMEEVWAKDAPIVTIHPNGPTLTSRAAVLQSWYAILLGPERPFIRCQMPRVFVHGQSAFVTCYEDLGGHVLAATNVFLREGGQWRLVHHQSGPTAGMPAEKPVQIVRVLH